MSHNSRGEFKLLVKKMTKYELNVTITRPIKPILYSTQLTVEYATHPVEYAIIMRLGFRRPIRFKRPVHLKHQILFAMMKVCLKLLRFFKPLIAKEEHTSFSFKFWSPC